jgi:hypothetical protein
LTLHIFSKCWKFQDWRKNTFLGTCFSSRKMNIHWIFLWRFSLNIALNWLIDFILYRDNYKNSILVDNKLEQTILIQLTWDNTWTSADSCILFNWKVKFYTPRQQKHLLFYNYDYLYLIISLYSSKNRCKKKKKKNSTCGDAWRSDIVFHVML